VIDWLGGGSPGWGGFVVGGVWFAWEAWCLTQPGG
jgi:hypothetical protein